MTVRTDRVLLGRPAREQTTHVIARVVDYLFGLLYTILLVRLVLDFFDARHGSGFYVFVRALSGTFYEPFRGIIPTDTIDGAHPVVWPLVVAIIAYMILHAMIRGLLHLVSRH